MNITIKELGIDEMSVLLDLRMEVLNHVFEEEKRLLGEFEWAALRKENEKYYKRELAAGGHIPAVIMVDDEIAGCGGVCLYNEMPSPDNRSGKCAYLMNIYVRESFRRRGLAKRICEYLIGRSRAEGAEKIYLESSDMAFGLYRSIGFRNMDGYLKLKIAQ